MKEFERVQIESRAEWRAWLETNHTQKESIWLVVFKKHVPEKWVTWDDMVDEALCFGWIDSRTRRLDADRTMFLLSPRRRGSPWSGLNKERVERLIEAGLMQPAGMALIEQAKADGSWTIYDDIENLVVPEDLDMALSDNPRASEHFASFSKSSKKNILWWIKSAKTEPTRKKRIAQMVRLAEQNLRANHPEASGKG